MKRVFYPLVKWGARLSLVMTAFAAARQHFIHEQQCAMQREEVLWLWQHPTAALETYWLPWTLNVVLALAFIAGTLMIFELRRGDGPAASLFDISIEMVEKPYLLIPLGAYLSWAVCFLVAAAEFTAIPSMIWGFIFIAFWQATDH